MHAKRLYGLMILSLVVGYGCAASAPKEFTRIWPPPPEDPRIVYLKSYRGASDVKKKSVLDIIFGAPASQLQKPYGVSAQGNTIYVTQTANPVVFAMDTKERKISSIGDRGQGRLSLPIGVAVAGNGTVFVSDAKLNRVFGFDGQGSLKVAIGKKEEFKNPGGVAVNDEAGRLYVVDTQLHSVHAYSLGGEPLFQFGKRGSGPGEFNYPTNVAVDRRTGNVYVVDTLNSRVQVFDKDGKFLRKFGELGDVPGTFSRPKGIGVDSEGHVYVVDAAFDNVQVFDENGQLLLIVGAAGTEPGYFQLPAGLYVDEKDSIYVVDQLNGRIQVFQYLSEKWKKEHPEEYKKYLMP